MLSHVNACTDLKASIVEPVRLVAEVTVFSGHVTFEATKPEGVPRKLVNVLFFTAQWWKSSIDFREGPTRVDEANSAMLGRSGRVKENSRSGAVANGLIRSARTNANSVAVA